MIKFMGGGGQLSQPNVAVKDAPRKHVKISEEVKKEESEDDGFDRVL